MNRLTFGSASCYLSAAAFLCLAWMGVCKLVIRNTPPGGTGDMTGIDHLGWGITIFLLMFAAPSFGVVGLLLGAIGSFQTRPIPRLVTRGIALNGLALMASPFVISWAFFF